MRDVLYLSSITLTLTPVIDMPLDTISISRKDIIIFFLFFLRVKWMIPLPEKIIPYC